MTVRVVPNVPSFSVDNGFRYAVPDRFTDRVRLGSIVRVPLGGRRVRGWVTEMSPPSDPTGIKEISGVSGSIAVFDAKLLKGLQWAAHHYLAPVSAMLGRATPPNLPGPITDGFAFPPEGGSRQEGEPGVMGEISVRVAAGRRLPTQAVVGAWRDCRWVSELRPILEAGRSAMVVVPTAVEAGVVARAARSRFGPGSVAVVEGQEDASVTDAWVKSQSGGGLLVGTPQVAAWKMEGLAMAIVIEEGRRAMKDRQSPTVHVRELVRTRGRIEGFTTVFLGPTPSLEVLSAGAEIMHVGSRAWPHVEVVDIADSQPGAGIVSAEATAAIRATVARGGRVFVLCLRPVVEPVARELSGRLGPGKVGTTPKSGAVIVGTERDLADVGTLELGVAVSVDAMISGPGYRSSEETLRVVVRLAGLLASGPGRRLMVQTKHPGHDLFRTLRNGDPLQYLEKTLLERARAGMPPSTEMIAIELRGKTPDDADSALRTSAEVVVMGPLENEAGMRWLLRGPLDKVRPHLRALISRWRESGVTVRIDVDPIDL